MGDRKALVYSDEFFRFDYGPYHPMRIERLKLAHDLMQLYGLLDLPDMWEVRPEPATTADMGRFHRPEYLSVLRDASRGVCPADDAAAYGLGAGDNPLFQGLWDWSLLITGATLTASRLVERGEARIAFNFAGGLHHAMPCRASGFCFVNDIAVAIGQLVDHGLKVVYVDLDAHHGDGVQAAFEETDRVLTISIHQHGRTLFPGTGFVFETGRGRGLGYAVNAPLMPGSDDALFLSVFNGLVPDLIAAYKPDILVTQLGVDTFRSDPLTSLCMTTNGFIAAVRAFKEMNLPWVALGGGGYHLVNVARAWTLAWAVMNDVELPDALPEAFIHMIRTQGYRDEFLNDAPFRTEGPGRNEAETVSRQVVETLRQTVLAALTRSVRSTPPIPTGIAVKA